MKPIYPFAFLGALLAVGAVNAATTTPVGYVTNTLNQGFNPIGLTLHSPVVAAGDLETVGESSVADSDVADFGALLVSGETYILEITTGSLSGVIQEVGSWTGSSLTTSDDLAEAGVEAGVSYTLRKAPTLEDIFGTTESVLKKGATAALADVVWIPTGPGTYNRYFLNASGAWRNAAGGAAPNVPVIYADGIFVERKDPGSVDLVVTGEVKKSNTSYVVVQGFNFVGVVSPVGSTLQNFGLEDDVKKGATAALADVVWVPTGPGTYDRFFLNASNAWRNAAGGAAAEDYILPGAFFIERKDPGSVLFDASVPESYSNL